MTQSIINASTLDHTQRIAPASLTQEGFWFLNQLHPEHTAHNIPIVLRIRTELDPALLARSLHALIQRHAILRTAFRVDKGELVQIIVPELTIALPVIDLQAWPKSTLENEVKRLAVEETNQPFDLTRGPLLRATLLHLAPQEHLLLLTAHPLIIDEWSTNILLGELTSFYNAFAHGQPLSLSEQPYQYTNFASWQREIMAGESMAEQLTYWKDQLADRPAALELQTDHPRTPQTSPQGAVYTFSFPRELTSAIEELSAQRDATFLMILMAAFQTLLHRYTGQEDLLLGLVVANRTRVETQRLIGLCTNILALRSQLSGTLSFSTLLEQVRAKILNAEARQELPLLSLVKALQPEQQTTRSSLFQVLVSMERPLADLPAGWEVMDLGSRAIISQAELFLKVQRQGEDVTCRFEYSSDLFDEATIARLASHLQTLLAGIVAQPSQHLAHLPLLTEQERQQMLVEWNDTDRAYPNDYFLHELFEIQAEATPEAVAVMLAERKLLYRELNQRANQLAHTLRQRGVGPGVMVGICLERSLEMVVGLLGILKAGGINVPIDPAFPAERISFILEDTHAPVLLTQQSLLAKLPASSLQPLCLDTDWQTISQQSPTNPTHLTQGEDLAYVIYTSGSTGQPKGVLFEHYALAKHCLNTIQTYQLRPEDCCLQFSPFTFDASIEQTFPPLLLGARLLLRGPAVWTATEFLEQIREHQITVLSLPCAYWHQTISEWAASTQELHNHPIRQITVGGDRLPAETVQLWRQSPLRSARLLNVYGPTEGTVVATCFEVPRKETHKEETIPIGRPVPNRRIYILDKQGEPVPVGVAGELSIGGNLLARGYLNRPELTAERFVADPFSQQPQARLYKTGDLARYQPGGIIEFLGRGDQQVKIHGFRIEPGEIEAVISQHPSVRQVVVVAREDTPDQKRLVAYVVPQPEQETSQLINQIRTLLKENMPDYMMPAAFVLLEALPLTANGKLNRQELPLPDMSKRTVAEQYVAPSSPIQYQLVQLWENLLGIQPIGIQDNFFEIGGHSLLAARLFDQVTQVFGKKLPLSLFFVDATIEHLARALLEEQKPVTETQVRAALIPLQETGSKRPFFYLHGDYLYGAFYCTTLARLLGSDQPFYIAEPYKFAGLDIMPSLEKIAAAYIQSMRSVQPEGPYLLGGWCSGGLVTYEIARQLRAAGEKIELLVLMDPSTAPKRDRSLRRLFARLGRLLAQKPDEQLNWYLRTVYTLRYLRRARFRRSRNAAPGSFSGPFHSNKLPNDTRLSLSRLFLSTKELRCDNELVFEWIASGYTPPIYTDKVTFFWTEAEPWRRDAWESDVQNLEREDHMILGSHLTSRTEHLPVLAEHLSACLNEVERETEKDPRQEAKVALDDKDKKLSSPIQQAEHRP